MSEVIVKKKMFGKEITFIIYDVEEILAKVEPSHDELERVGKISGGGFEVGVISAVPAAEECANMANGFEDVNHFICLFLDSVWQLHPLVY